jgi:fructoselysine-6-phosphate deglycase
MPAELLVNGSRHLGEHTLVVIPSLSGTTRESLDVAEFCKKRGATVMALTGDGNSPLARTADVSFENSAADDTSSESFYIQSLLVSLAVMDARSELDDYERLVEEFAALPSVLVRAKREFEGKAAQIACHITNTSWHIFTGAGSSWPEVHYFAMCILEEMQWIRTRPVHAADFFHGTLELVEAGISVVATMGEDPSRGLVERVEQFVRQFSDQLVVVDAAAIAKGELSARLRSLVSPVLLAAVLERVAAHVEAITEHPLVTRRYYRQMDY